MPHNVNTSRSAGGTQRPLAQLVGERIRLAREAAELSQAQLAELLGRSRSSVSLWEAGERAPGVDDLLDVAAAVGRPISFFLPESAREPAEDRQVAALSLRAIADQLSGSHVGSEVQQAIAKAETMPPPPIVVSPRSREPIEAAHELLSALDSPMPPVDVTHAALLLGARVVLREYSSDALSGFLLHLIDGPVISANSRQSPGRQRFTLAHELGHLILGHHADFHLDLLSSVNAGDPPGYDWRHERAANTFAANLLMPASMVRDDRRAGMTPAQLAKRYGVSKEAVGIRVASLGLS
ncbi:MAG: ImmA/IrrE family metallo-endopeptidase [Gaiellaceae bacterium]